MIFLGNCICYVLIVYGVFKCIGMLFRIVKALSERGAELAEERIYNFKRERIDSPKTDKPTVLKKMVGKDGEEFWYED